MKSIPIRVNVVILTTSYTTLVATDRERLDFIGKSKWSGEVATGYRTRGKETRYVSK